MHKQIVLIRENIDRIIRATERQRNVNQVIKDGLVAVDNATDAAIFIRERIMILAEKQTSLSAGRGRF